MNERRGPSASLGILLNRRPDLDVDSEGIALNLQAKYELQDIARKLLPIARVQICTRYIAIGKETVTVNKSHDEGSTAFYGNLMRCDSVWTCPVCASRIGTWRQVELALALATVTSRVALVTYTLSHNSSDSLNYVMGTIGRAYRKIKSGRWFQDWRQETGYSGCIRTLELTWGENGWHPHYHELMIFEEQIPTDEQFEKYNLRWCEIVSALGGFASKEHGLDIRIADTYIAGYVAKMNRMPEVASWDDTSELARMTSKTGKTDHYTYLDLLVHAGKGDSLAGQLIHEYYVETLGKRHLVWSRGLKQLLGVDEITDSDISELLPHQESFEIATIDRLTWFKILSSNDRIALLQVASRMLPDHVRFYLHTYQSGDFTKLLDQQLGDD